MSRWSRWVVAILAAVLTLGAVASWRISRQARQFGKSLVWSEGVANVTHAELLMEFPRAIRESSGVVASVANPGIFWTHNDSGNPPVLFAVRPSDGFTAKIRLDGAGAQDWEDIATGPCLSDISLTCLYVGDIGDNWSRRSSIAVLVAEEPRFSGSDDLPDELEWTAVPLAYVGGSRNAEALAVSEDGDLLVVSRSGVVFSALRKDIEAGLEGDHVVLLHPDGALPRVPEPPGHRLGPVTAAAFSGADLVVKTYQGVHFYRRTATRWEATRQPCWVGHLGPVGEGLDVAPPDILYLTREKLFGLARPAALHRVICPP